MFTKTSGKNTSARFFSTIRNLRQKIEKNRKEKRQSLFQKTGQNKESSKSLDRYPLRSRQNTKRKAEDYGNETPHSGYSSESELDITSGRKSAISPTQTTKRSSSTPQASLGSFAPGSDYAMTEKNDKPNKNRGEKYYKDSGSEFRAIKKDLRQTIEKQKRRAIRESNLWKMRNRESYSQQNGSESETGSDNYSPPTTREKQSADVSFSTLHQTSEKMLEPNLSLEYTASSAAGDSSKTAKPNHDLNLSELDFSKIDLRAIETDAIKYDDDYFPPTPAPCPSPEVPKKDESLNSHKTR